MESEILQSAPNDPKPNSRNRASKVPYIYALQYTESQIFVCFALRSAFFEIFHILGFPLTPMLKFQKCHNTLFLADHQNIHNFISPYDCRIYRKVWHWSDEKCTRSSILKFPAPHGSVLTKFQSGIIFLNFGRSPKQLQPEFPHDQHTYNKIWLKFNEN